MPASRFLANIFSNLLEDTLLELPLNLLALVVGTRLAVESHQCSKIELGRLEQLDLADVDLSQHISALPINDVNQSRNSRSGGGRCPGWTSQSRGQ